MGVCTSCLAPAVLEFRPLGEPLTVSELPANELRYLQLSLPRNFSVAPGQQLCVQVTVLEGAAHVIHMTRKVRMRTCARRNVNFF